jgi:hypothetical protein
VDSAIRQTLHRYLVEGVEAPANLSVRIGGSTVAGEDPEAEEASVNGNGKRRSGQGQHIHVLYRSSSLAARSRVPSRILWALVSYLDGFLDHAHADDSLLQTSMLGLVTDGHAIVAPRSLLGSLKVLQPRLERQGMRFVDSPFAMVDPSTRELVVPGSPLEIDGDALHSLDKEFGARGRGDEGVRPGRYAIKGWASFAAGADDEGPMTRSKAVAAAAGAVLLRDQEPQSVLETLAEMFRVVPSHALWYDKPQDAAKSLIRLAGG